MSRHGPSRSPLWKVLGLAVCILLGVILGLAAPDPPQRAPRNPDSFTTQP